MKIGLAQINPTIGDLEGNLARAQLAYCEAAEKGADLVVFPELSVIGYCPKDLLLRNKFLLAVGSHNAKWASMSKSGPDVLFGTVLKSTKGVGKLLYNSAVYAKDGVACDSISKCLLPTYDVFDEGRWFEPGRPRSMGPLGVCVCEDIWNDKDFWNERLYCDDPVAQLVVDGAELIINLSASPYAIGKPCVRREMLSHAARKHGLPVVYVNQVGANDDVVYDGHSMVFCSDGELAWELPSFEEAVLVVDTNDLEPFPFEPSRDEDAETFGALVLGVKDYARKCGFKKAVIGLSGGIDSALTAAVAKEALGGDNVLGVGMPSEFSSKGSVNDAQALARNLGMPFREISIAGMYDAFHSAMGEDPKAKDVQLWQENLQARIRGATLMSISNKDGRLLLTTGNKSEVAVGYCTLYGDTCGGLAVLSDVYKTMVYRLARWYNRSRKREFIPAASIEKPPSAELRPGQEDSQSLPPYDELDAVLSCLIENGMEPDEIAELGNGSESAMPPEDVIRSIAKKVDQNEYKRRQLAPGIRVTKKAFGTGRLMPIAQGWRK